MKCAAGEKARGLAILCLVLFSFSGCIGNVKPTLTLKITSLPVSLDEEIRLVLDNPGKEELFIPVDWEGIEIFRMGGDGKWIEYRKAASPMFSTNNEQAVYYIPVGTLVPGKYKLVLQGRRGKEGTLINLETDLDLKPFSNTMPSGI